MENKICVYAICKNESKFVERWVSSMCEANYIVVLDTGSTDGTFELLKNDDRVTYVGQKIINPWRFDVARNWSMQMIPEDANILVCTDLDEILRPGWADALRKNWVEGQHVRCHYQYIWSHDDVGQPARIFGYDKIHDRNWSWRHPVHELLYDTANRGDDFVNTHILNLWDDIILEHFPDNTKSRSSYLPLLELRAEESPDDYYGLFYLSHEYHYQHMYTKSIDLLKHIVDDYKTHYSTTELAAAYLFLGDNYRALGEKEKSLYYYNRGIFVEPTYRECYLNAAEVYNELQMYEFAVAYVKTALRKTFRHYTWVERDTSYKTQPNDILSIALYYLAMDETYSDRRLELLQEADKLIKEVLAQEPGNLRFLYNQSFIADALEG